MQRFLGVPYAEPPVGPLRFRPPEPKAPWDGVRDALEPGPAAPQPWIPDAVGLDVSVTAEDCLFLNLWTPRCDDGRRPVMVWLHSGGLMLGAGTEAVYAGEALARENDIVVVTLNHRLGVLGGFIFLNELGDERFAESANVGLLDQWMVLRWTRANIAAFGGDPESVTLAGESAGGLAVVMAMASRATTGLYQRTWAMSPAPTRILERDRAAMIAEDYLRRLGDPTPDDLLAMSADEIVRPGLDIHAAYRHGRDLLAFQPIVDGVVFAEQPLLTLAEGSSADAPAVVGTTRDELAAILPGATEGESDEDAAIEEVCRVALDPEEADRVRRAYSAATLGALDPPPASRPKAVLQSDRIIRLGAIRALEAQSANQAGTYAYMFGWEGTHGHGSTHQIDIPFLFGTLDAPGYVDIVGDHQDARALSESFRRAFVAFMRDGVPGDDLGVEWPAYEQRQRATLYISSKSIVFDDPWSEQRQAWQELS